MTHYKMTIKNRSTGGPEQFKPVSKLQLIKFGVIVVIVLAVIIAFFLAAFFIGLLLAIPLILIGIVWFIYMVLRGKIRIRQGPV